MSLLNEAKTNSAAVIHLAGDVTHKRLIHYSRGIFRACSKMMKSNDSAQVHVYVISATVELTFLFYSSVWIYGQKEIQRKHKT